MPKERDEIENLMKQLDEKKEEVKKLTGLYGQHKIITNA